MHTETGPRERPELALGSGSSDANEATDAAREAVNAAIGTRTPRSADVVIVFADVAFEALEIVEAAGDAARPARVIACSSAAPFSAQVGPARCVATHIPAGDLRFGIGWRDVPVGALQEATRDAVADARAEAAHHADDAVVLLLSDVRTGDQREVIWGAYDVAGATVPLVGGTVGHDAAPERNWLAADGMVLRWGLVAVWIASTSPLGVAIDHGWRPVGRPMQVTQVVDGELLELDGQPAAEAYADARADVDPSCAELGAAGMDLPLGVPGDVDGYEVRAFVTHGPDGLELRGNVHEQAIVRLMGAEHQDLIDGAARAVTRATAQLGRPSRGALVFSCNTRRDLLQAAVVQEIAAIEQAMGGGPAVGFFTHGEFAKVPGSQGFHSASVAVLAL